MIFKASSNSIHSMIVPQKFWTGYRPFYFFLNFWITLSHYKWTKIRRNTTMVNLTRTRGVCLHSTSNFPVFQHQRVWPTQLAPGSKRTEQHAQLVEGPAWNQMLHKVHSVTTSLPRLCCTTVEWGSQRTSAARQLRYPMSRSRETYAL